MPNRRAGKAPNTAATSGTAGVPGTSAELRVFAQGAHSPVIVHNTDDDTPVYVAIGGTAASATNWQFVIAQGTSADISVGGILAIDRVSLWAAVGLGADYAKVKVYGFND